MTKHMFVLSTLTYAVCLALLSSYIDGKMVGSIPDPMSTAIAKQLAGKKITSTTDRIGNLDNDADYQVRFVP